MTYQKEHESEQENSPLKNLMQGFLTGSVIIGGIFGTLALLFGVSLILSLPTYWLWNWLMPIIFNLPEITWFQAWGLNFLCGILFKTSIVKK